MTDVLDILRSYPDDASITMSKRVVADVVDEIARLRAELAAALQDAEDLNIEVEHYANLAIVDLGANPTVSWMERAEAAEAERDALRAHLEAEQGVIARYRAAMAELRAERDALRAQLAEAREVVAEAVQWLRVSDLPCEMTIFRADAVRKASSSANGDDSDA